MKCEFLYCIYNQNRNCLLDEIEINSLGMCEECIIVSLDDQFLEIEKAQQLKEIETRWIKYENN